MTLRYPSTEVQTGESRLSGYELRLGAAVKRYALVGKQSGLT